MHAGSGLVEHEVPALDQSELFEAFVSRWRVDTSSDVETTDEGLSLVEDQLSFRFPQAYVQFTNSHGFPYTPDILDTIVDSELDLTEINNFENPSQMLESTRAYEKSGMPAGFIAIASDSMGNLFLFKLAECRGDADAPIWLFDHDFGSMEKVAPSFAEWLSRYVDL